MGDKELQGLISRLKNYNRWRRGSDVVKQPDPKQLGKDLDRAIGLLEGKERKDMNKKELAQAVIDKYGEENQRLMMIEEMAELTVAICHVLRGRFCSDQVAEEVADCLAMLDQMDILFGSPIDVGFVMFHGYPDLMSVMGDIQIWLSMYSGEKYEKKVLGGLFSKFRHKLEGLWHKLGESKVDAWLDKKHERMVERLKRHGK